MSEFGVGGCQCRPACEEQCSEWFGVRFTCRDCGCKPVVLDRDHFDIAREDALCPTVWDHDYMQEGRL